MSDFRHNFCEWCYHLRKMFKENGEAPPPEPNIYVKLFNLGYTRFEAYDYLLEEY